MRQPQCGQLKDVVAGAKFKQGHLIHGLHNSQALQFVVLTLLISPECEGSKTPDQAAAELAAVATDQPRIRGD